MPAYSPQMGGDCCAPRNVGRRQLRPAALRCPPAGRCTGALSSHTHRYTLVPQQQVLQSRQYHIACCMLKTVPRHGPTHVQQCGYCAFHSRRPLCGMLWKMQLLSHALTRGAGEVISVRPGDDVAAIYDVQPRQPGEPHLRAAFVVLAMNRDAPDVVLSMQRLLHRFNNTDTRSASRTCPHSSSSCCLCTSCIHWVVQAGEVVLP